MENESPGFHLGEGGGIRTVNVMKTPMSSSGVGAENLLVENSGHCKAKFLPGSSGGSQTRPVLGVH